MADDEEESAGGTTSTFGKYNEYPDGSIIRIVFKNFLTYDSAVCSPGPRLNVIIGSNGSGKSSIICGICLAVGGSPKVLGRSDRFSDYIKHQKESGFVELTIRDRVKGDQRVKVVMKRPNSVEYFLNDSKVAVKVLRDEIASYNIQIDNPCTFLAQDKVKSFSEQKPEELLKNTENAGNPALLEMHEELERRQKAEQNAETFAADNKKKLATVQGEMTTLEPRVENYKKKEAHRSKIYAIRKRKAIVTYEVTSERLKKEEEGFADVLRKVNEAKKKFDEAEIGMRKSKNLQNVCRDEKSNIELKVRNLRAHLTALEDNDKYSATKRVIESEFARAKERGAKWGATVAKLKEDLERKRALHQKASKEAQGYEAAAENYKSLMREIAEDEAEMEKDARECEAEATEITNEQNNIRRLRNVGEQFDRDRLRILENRFGASRSGDAWRWYLQNRNRFEHPVFIPVLHMQLLDDKSATLLENLIAVRDIAVFVFGSKNDERLLAGAGNWRISSTVVPPNSVVRAQIEAEIDRELVNYGFTSLAVQLIRAPEQVTHYLCQTSGLHKVPVGGSVVSDNIDSVLAVLRQRNMHLFLTDRYRVMINISRYSGESIVQQNGLRPGSVFFCHGPNKWSSGLKEVAVLENKLEKAKAQYIEKQSLLDKAKEALEKRRTAAKEEFSGWRQKRECVQISQSHMKAAETILTTEEASRPDLEAAEEARKERLAKAADAAFKFIHEHIKGANKLREYITQWELLNITMRHLAQSNFQAEDTARQLLGEFNNVKNELTTLEQQLTRQKNMKKSAEKEFIRLIQITTIHENKMNAAEKRKWKELKEEFEKESVPLDADLPKLEAMEHEEDARLNLVSVGGDKKDVERMEQLKIEEEQLLEKIERDDAASFQRKNRMQEEVEKWVEPLKKVVERINANFAAFFEQLGCTGEVRLDEPVHKLDVHKYGIMIMVRFRNGERLRRLDNQTQSGGERSVSTMLFLLALQEECPVPFRCVDEINQGMDPTNERKVFDVMVEKLSGQGNLGKNQYFLLTPKLLRDLKYSPSVTVLVVHNASTLSRQNAKNWNAFKTLAFLRSRAR